MKTKILSIFFLTFLTLTFFSCNKETPIEPQNLTSLQTDGEEENSNSFCPLIQYSISQTFYPYPLGGDKDEEDAVPVELIINEGVTHVCAANQYYTWYSEGPVHFTPNQTLIIGSVMYVPANSQISVHSEYFYSPFGQGLFIYAIRNKLYAGSTHLGTYGDDYLPTTMPSGGYSPSSPQTYTTSGNIEDHELHLGFYTDHP